MSQIAILRIIAGALTASIVLLTLLPFVVVEPGETDTDIGVMMIALSVVSLAVLIAIPILRKITIGSVAIMPVADPIRPVTASALDAATNALAAASKKYQTGTIIGLALAESIATYGFVLAFLAKEPSYSPPFGLVALVAAVVQFPREAALLGLLEPEDRQAIRQSQQRR